MKVQVEFGYLIQQIPPGRNQRASLPDRTRVVAEVEIAVHRQAPPAAAFSVVAEAVLPSIRAPHDVRYTLMHDGRPWMAFSDQKAEAGSRVVAETLRRRYVHEFDDYVRMHSQDEGRTWAERTRETLARVAGDLAVFADGRLYQADVTPIYEIRGRGPRAGVFIVPSTMKRLEQATYFGHDEEDAARDFCGRTADFPAVACHVATELRELAAVRTLDASVKAVVASLCEGMPEATWRRWMRRVGGEAFLGTVAAAAQAPTASLPESIGTASDLLAKIGLLRFGPEDPLSELAGRLDAGIADAERELAEIRPAGPGPR